MLLAIAYFAYFAYFAYVRRGRRRGLLPHLLDTGQPRSPPSACRHSYQCQCRHQRDRGDEQARAETGGPVLEADEVGSGRDRKADEIDVGRFGVGPSRPLMLVCQLPDQSVLTTRNAPRGATTRTTMSRSPTKSGSRLTRPETHCLPRRPLTPAGHRRALLRTQRTRASGRLLERAEQRR